VECPSTGEKRAMADDTAGNKPTGKEKKITTGGRGGFRKDEVDGLGKAAKSQGAEDQARRDLIDVRNQADTLAYQVEKTVNENRGKVAVGELSRVEAAIAEARKAVQGDDVASIKRAIDDLQRASHAMAEALYKGSTGSAGSQGSTDSRGSTGSDVKDGEVVDAEYAESAK